MAFLIGLVVTALAVPLAIWLSPRLKLVDLPSSDPLKIHQRPIPRSGGLAIAGGMVGTLLVVRPSIGWLIGGAGALTLGLVDDRVGLSPGFRILAETALATGTALLLVDPISSIGGWLRVVVGVMVIVVAINAANLLDGMDGLLPGAGFVTAIGLAVLLAGQSWMWALAGCLLGFLLYNRPPAGIFLGDGGAYLVGLTLGAGLLLLSTSQPKFLGGTVVFGLIGVDFVMTLLRRWRKKRPLFAGDRSHLYDQLVDRGWSVWRTLAVMWGTQAGLMLVGLGIARLSPVESTIAVGAMAALILLTLWRLGFIDQKPTPEAGAV